MVFYRKYRSQTIDELDSESLRTTLNSIFLANITSPHIQKLSDKSGTPKKASEYITISDSIPHAFLFTGPKGLGKTSAARIVAKVLNCLELRMDDQQVILCDNHCYQCKSIANGSNIDILEIDGASNRGIDEVRDLREKVRLAPASARKKVYIIDEVHMLTTEAFNALLKTIEEPPSHVIFIFCTTEGHKVPPTIMSRCFNIPFHIATGNELTRSFLRIVKGEKLDIDEDTLKFIASLADGSFRDGAKMLEELSLIAKDKTITRDLVEERFNLRSISSKTDNLLASLRERNAKVGITIISELIKDGTDIKYFTEQLIEELHKHVLMEVGVIPNTLPVDMPKFSLEDIKKLVSLFTKAYMQAKYTAIPELPLELAIIEWAPLRQEATTGQAGSTSLELGVKKVEVVSKAANQEFPRTAAVQQGGGQAGAANVVRVVTKDVEMMEQLIARAKIINQSVAGVLRSCYVQKYDGKTLILATKYKFHKERLDETKAMEILHQVTQEIAGNSVEISVLLSEKMV